MVQSNVEIAVPSRCSSWYTSVVDSPVRPGPREPGMPPAFSLQLAAVTHEQHVEHCARRVRGQRAEKCRGNGPKPKKNNVEVAAPSHARRARNAVRFASASAKAFRRSAIAASCSASWPCCRCRAAASCCSSSTTPFSSSALSSPRRASAWVSATVARLTQSTSGGSSSQSRLCWSASSASAAACRAALAPSV